MSSLNPLVRKVIYLVLTCALLALWMLPASTEILCRGSECQSSAELTGKTLKRDLVQTFDIEMRVLPHRGESYFSDFMDNDKGIGLSWNQEHRLLITVPMRNGSASVFGYITPKDLEFKRIRLRIEKSESIYVFVDEKIAYSHRYENHPFFVNSSSPVDTPKRAGKVIFTANILEQMVEKKTNPLPRVGSVLLIIFLFASATSALLKRFFPGKPRAVDVKHFLGNSLYGFVGISWLLTILAWIRNPIDATGAINPGPFGPIGAAFSDFFQLAQLSQFDRPYDLGGTNYPPAGILFLRLISFYDPNNLSFFPIAGVMLGTIYFLFGNSFDKKSTSLIFLGSFPFIFGVIRGNLDVLAIFFIWISILTWRNGRNSIAVITLAFAIAIKIWPIVFLLFFIKKRNRSLFFITTILSLVLTILASFTLGYTNLLEIVDIASSAIFDQAKLGTYAFQNTFSFSSILFICHIALMARNPFDISQIDVDNSLAFVNGIFSSLFIFTLLIVLIYFFFKSRNVGNEFLTLSGIVLLIPTQSFTYRALIVLLYFTLPREDDGITNNARSRNPSIIRNKKKTDSIFANRSVVWFLIPLFAPTSFYFIPGTQFSTASLLQPLGLLVFIGLAIYQERKSFPKVG